VLPAVSCRVVRFVPPPRWESPTFRRLLTGGALRSPSPLGVADFPPSPDGWCASFPLPAGSRRLSAVSSRTVRFVPSPRWESAAFRCLLSGATLRSLSPLGEG